MGGMDLIYDDELYKTFLNEKRTIHNSWLRESDETFFGAMLSREVGLG